MNNQPKQSKLRAKGRALRGVCACLAVLFCPGYSQEVTHNSSFIPLPEDVLPETQSGNPIMEMADRAISSSVPVLDPKMPDSVIVHNEDGEVYYDVEKRLIIYRSGENENLRLNTNEGQEIIAGEIIADFNLKNAKLKGPVTIYQGESLTLANSGEYDWEKGEATIEEVRAKVEGLLVRGSRLEYKQDTDGKDYLVFYDAFVSTEDVEKPDMWVGTGKLTVYPGDYGVIDRLSLAFGDYDMRVPVLGWMPISHSLNPREGYLPLPGVKSIWGTYIRNRYGVLLGNRRVEHGMPVADYVATGLLDYRSRRGYAGGFEFEDEAMRHRFADTEGFSAYYAADKSPHTNPTRRVRVPINGDRYRIAMKSFWKLPELIGTSAGEARWTLAATGAVLSDRYVLRDFFEDYARVDDKPDNSVRLERFTPKDDTMLLTRFSVNNYYSTDRRVELSYYRVRSAVGNSRIFYETRNSAGLLSQYITPEQRVLYKQRINNLRYADMREYYTRLLNTDSYFRVNTTHEFSSSMNVFRFLNVTPKVGAGYSGYYDVSGVGSDHRLLGYLAVDFDIKFYRHFRNLRIPSMGVYGLYHVFHPYATISHVSISSSNELVPQADSWSSRLGGSTVNPMPLDLMSFTGVDGWGNWTVWRLGVQNSLSTNYDGESRSLLDWDLFVDYNVENPNTETLFSNLYSIITLKPCQQVQVTLETQTPTIRGGDGFYQYNTSVTIIPFRWLETTVGHRFIKNHPTRADASQAYMRLNLRVNERYTISSRVNWDFESHRIPIQQYSLFRKFGAWYVGSTVFLRNNGGKKETGMGVSFTLGETGTSLPVNFF